MSRAWEAGSTRAWRRVRARVLARDGYRCQLQLAGCTTRATQVHHTVGRGVSEAEEHLTASCQSCNLKAGDPRALDPAPRAATRW